MSKKLSVFIFIIIAAFTLISISFLVINLNPTRASNDEIPALELPSANKKGDNLVPLKIVKELALKKAQEIWGQVVPGKPIECCDEEGVIVAYMCPFRIGEKAFPNYEQIMRGVIEARKMVKDIENFTYKTFDPKLNHEKLKKAQKKYGVLTNMALYMFRHDMIDIPFLSAHTIYAPIISRGDLCKKKAKHKLGKDCSLARYYFLGHSGQYFEFVSEDDTVFVDAYSSEIEFFKSFNQPIPTNDKWEKMLNVKREKILTEWDRKIEEIESIKEGQ